MACCVLEGVATLGHIGHKIVPIAQLVERPPCKCEKIPAGAALFQHIHKTGTSLLINIQGASMSLHLSSLAYVKGL